MTARGALVAAAVAGMFASGAQAIASPKAGAKVHCAGINECKGKGACKSATSECSGHNECKGKGWVETTDKECKAKGGTVAKI